MLLLENDQHRETNDLFNLRLVILLQLSTLQEPLSLFSLDKKEQAKNPYFNGDVYGKAQKSLLQYRNTYCDIRRIGRIDRRLYYLLFCKAAFWFLLKPLQHCLSPVKNRVAELPYCSCYKALLFGIIISWIFSRGSKRQRRS